MTNISRARIIELLAGDEAFFDELARMEIVPPDNLTPDQVEYALVAYTLVCDLDVNLPGVEVILRLRRQLLETRAQLARLAETLVAPRGKPSK